MADNTNKEKDLFFLHELSNYKVAKGYPDVRNWKMNDTDGRTVGKVAGLLVSKKAERVVYLDIKVDESVIEAGHDPYAASASSGIHEFLNAEGEDHLIVPIGMADIDEENKVVMSNKIDHATFAKTRRYADTSSIDRNYELKVFGTYTPAFIVDDVNVEEDDFYNRNEFGFPAQNYPSK